MSPKELEDLQKRTSQQSDQDLLKIVNDVFESYRKETIGLARAELEKRGVLQPLGLEPNKESKQPVVAPSLRRARDKPEIPEKPAITDPSISRQVSVLMKRYRDAYIVARVTNSFGGVIKGIGIMIAVVLVFVGFMVASSGGPRDPNSVFGIMGIVVGVIAGTLFYVIGVLVSAQGQILKASLDGAVNNSPFLTNEHRAKIMSLPEA